MPAVKRWVEGRKAESFRVSSSSEELLKTIKLPRGSIGRVQEKLPKANYNPGMKRYSSACEDHFATADDRRPKPQQLVAMPPRGPQPVKLPPINRLRQGGEDILNAGRRQNPSRGRGQEPSEKRGVYKGLYFDFIPSAGRHRNSRPNLI